MNDIKKENKRLKIAVLILALIIFTGLISIFLFSRKNKKEELNQRPLVLITQPKNKRAYKKNDLITINSKAFSEQGIKSLQVFLNGNSIKKTNLKEKNLKDIKITVNWLAEATGVYELIVEAESKNNEKGQSSLVFLVEEEKTTVEEDKTVEESLQTETNLQERDENTTKEEETGQEETIDDTGEPEESEITEETEETVEEGIRVPEYSIPLPHNQFSLAETLGSFFSDEEAPASETEAENRLRIELVGLKTESEYDSTHCYIGLGENSPQWYPDIDSDQSTDEYFESAGGTEWNIADYLSGSSSLETVWTEDRDFPIEINCVAITNEGTEAVNLGNITLSIPASDWDGSLRQAVGKEGESVFTLDYIIGDPDEREVPGIPLYLDPTMTPPTNLHYDQRRQELQWEYNPAEDEPSINGFAVYLNNTLQWTVRPNRQYSRLPLQWLKPPCGVDYSFTVTAFRGNLPDGPESTATIPGYVVEGGEVGTQDCNKEVIVTFKNMQTGDLGNDGNRDPGDAGPIIGTFYANDRLLSLDGRCNDRRDNFCSERGWNNNSTYQIMDLLNNYGTGPNAHSNQVLVTIPEGEDLWIGYEIIDYDRRNSNDLVCSAETWVQSNQLDNVHEKTVTSERSRCRMEVDIRPGGGSPIGSREDWTPLPQLWVSDLTVDDETGQLEVHVKNIGTASVASQNIKLGFTRRNGTAYDTNSLIWQGLTLEPGEEKVFTNPIIRPRPALSVCVQLDPDNQFHEAFEESQAIERQIFCKDLADLIITDSSYNSERNSLHITVQNQGEGILDNRVVNLRGSIPFRSDYLFDKNWHFSLEPGESKVLSWTDVSEEARDSMELRGYNLELDPLNRIAETNEDNNQYQVNGRKRVKVRWIKACFPYFVAGRNNHANISLNVEKVARHTEEQIVNWSTGEMTLHEWTEGGYRNTLDSTKCWRREYPTNPSERTTDYISITGDERLKISAGGSARVGTRDYNLYDITENFNVARGLEETFIPGLVEDTNICGGMETYYYNWASTASVPLEDNTGYRWTTSFVICVEE